MGTNKIYPSGSRLQIRTTEVKGAYSEADKVTAAPSKAKLTGIKFIPKYLFAINDTINPKNAPATILGAKTPPSPPAPNVKADAKGFRTATAKRNKTGIADADSKGFVRISFRP